MTTQVIFKIDDKLKKQALKKAQAQGVGLSTVLKFATQAFVSGKLNIGLVQNEEFNQKTQRILQKRLKDVKAGKNLSPTFTNPKDALEYLHSK